MLLKLAVVILFLQTRQAVADPRQQVPAQQGRVDKLHRLLNKSLDKHSTRLRIRDSAGAQVKERRLVEITDCGTMAALYVIGEDLELGLGVDRCPRAQHQILAELVCVDLLCPGAHRDAALEGAVSAPGGHSFEYFASFAARRCMIYRSKNVGLLTAGQ